MGHSFRIGYRLLKVGTTPRHTAAPRNTGRASKAVYWAGAAASPSIKTSFHIWAGWMMDLGFLERMRLSPPTASLVQSWQPLSSFVELAAANGVIDVASVPCREFLRETRRPRTGAKSIRS